MLPLFMNYHTNVFFNLSELTGVLNQFCSKENENKCLTNLCICKQYLITYMIIIFRFHLRYKIRKHANQRMRVY